MKLVFNIIYDFRVLMYQLSLHVLALVLFSFTIFSQFSVKPNTAVSLNDILSSLERYNTLNATLKGNGFFSLNGNNQNLSMGINGIVSNICIANASVFIADTPMLVKGDVTAERGMLILQHHLTIQRILYLQGDASLEHTQYLGVWFRSVKDLNEFVMKIQQRTLLSPLYATLVPTQKRKRVGIYESYVQTQYQSEPLMEPP